MTNLHHHSSVHMEDDDINPTNLQWQTSVQIEEINNDEDNYPCNVAPLNPLCLLKLSDGSDDEEPALIKVDDDKEDEEAEESAEAELSQSQFKYIDIVLTDVQCGFERLDLTCVFILQAEAIS